MVRVGRALKGHLVSSHNTSSCTPPPIAWFDLVVYQEAVLHHASSTDPEVADQFVRIMQQIDNVP